MSLARLLVSHRRALNRLNLPRLTIQQILFWAQAHYQEHGTWPNADSGPIPGTRETWLRIETALRQGNRGLEGGSSLAQLLAHYRGVRNDKDLPPFTEDQILSWADAHHRRTGQWPTAKSGPIHDAQQETWLAVHDALYHGGRGLPGGSSLAQLLTLHRGVRNEKRLPDLTVEMILAWADAHHQRTGHWPNRKSGPIAEAPGETWMAIEHALYRGSRGLPGGSSLTGLLAEHRGRRSRQRLPNLTVEIILAWADAHHQRTGTWPGPESGIIAESPGTTWLAVHKALSQGGRGFPGGSSLQRFLEEHGRRRRWVR
jgi:hypothetical protein